MRQLPAKPQLRPSNPPASPSAMQRPECQLRRMRLADLPSVMDLERQAYPYPWRQGMFSDCLKQGDECWLLAHGGRLIGHSVLALGAGESHLLNLCVHPASQGQGFGRVLAEHTVAQARARFATVVFLEVRPSNHAAQRLYQTLGFNQIGVRPNYYPAPQGREDALVLAKPLQNARNDGL